MSEDEQQSVMFKELPKEYFPFLIEFLAAGTQEVLWSERVDTPGVIQVPGQKTLGQPVDARATYGLGTDKEFRAITYVDGRHSIEFNRP